MPYLGAARSRASRYIIAWIWLGRYGAHSRLLLFFSVIFLAICSRLGLIVGFVATVQSVVFIIDLPKIPNFATQLGISNPETFTIILVSLPALIFLIVAIAQNLFERFAAILKSKISIDLATQKFCSLTLVIEPIEIPTVAIQVAEYQKRFLAVYRVITSFINSLVFGSVFALTVMVGIFINPLIMGSTILIAVFLGGIFLIKRHRESLLYESGGSLRTENIKQAKLAFQKHLKNNEDNENAYYAVQQASKSFNLATLNAQKSKESIQTQSKLLVDLIQAFVILSFLLLVVGESVDTAKVGTLTLLVLIVRFSVTYFQGLIKTILLLSKDYPLVVAMRLEQIDLRNSTKLPADSSIKDKQW